MGIYDFEVTAQDGSRISLSDYRGKVLLIVNTATGCGFTPQYDELQALYEDCRDKGLEILDFPCNQFGEHTSGDDQQIHSFCTLRFGIAFPQFSKVEVLGEHAEPLFRWLSENTRFEGFGLSPMGLAMNGIAKKMDRDYKKNGNIKWNFTKFLISRDGQILARFEPTVPMKTVMEAVRKAL